MKRRLFSNVLPFVLAALVAQTAAAQVAAPAADSAGTAGDVLTVVPSGIQAVNAPAPTPNAALSVSAPAPLALPTVSAGPAARTADLSRGPMVSPSAKKRPAAGLLQLDQALRAAPRGSAAEARRLLDAAFVGASLSHGTDVSVDLPAASLARPVSLPGTGLNAAQGPRSSYKGSWLGSLKARIIGAALTGLVGVSAVPPAAHAQPNDLILAVGKKDTQSTTAAHVTQAADVVARWKVHQHLYVKGDLKVSDAQLDELEQWLDQNAPNWTVVLVQSAAGERYVDNAGKSHDDRDAVEYALGQGLSNKTDFHKLADPRTKEKDGAIFVLFAKEAKVSYFSSEAYDKRDLGRDQWVPGNLNQWARAAWRNGGRVVDAAKDTITNIDQRLGDKIAAESARAAAAALQQAQAQARAESDYKAAPAAMDDLGRSIDSMASNPYSSSIAKELGEARADLASARAAHARHDPAYAARIADARERLDAASHQLRVAGQAFETGKSRLDAASRRLTELKGRPNASAASSELQDARRDLELAGTEWSKRDPSFSTTLRHAEEETTRADAKITQADEAASHRRILFGLLGLLAGAAALFLNLRRRGAKKDAFKRYGDWDAKLKEKWSAFEELDEKARFTVGEFEDDARKRFEGEDLEKALAIIKNVDEARLLLLGAGQVLKDAKAVLMPSNPFTRLLNLFRPGPYAEAQAVLSNRVINADEDIQEVLRSPKSLRQRLIGRPEDYKLEPITFDGLNAEYDKRADEALKGVTAIDEARGSKDELFETVRKAIGTARSKEAELKSASEEPLFLAPSIYSNVLATAETKLALAEDMGLKSPVAAVKGPGAEAKRLAGRTSWLADQMIDLRKEVLPGARTAQKSLAEKGLSGAWIDERLEALSSRMEELCAASQEKDSAAPFTSIVAEAKSLSALAGQAVWIEAKRGSAAASAASTASAIEGARKEIGEALKLAPESILREKGSDPSTRLAQAEVKLSDAKTALDRGGVEAAANAVDEAKRLDAEASALVEAARAAFGGHAGTRDGLERETEGLELLTRGHAAILKDIEADYAPSVLLLGSGDPAHPNANGTVQDNIDEANDHLATIRMLLERAEREFTSGRVLASAELMRQVGGHQQFVRYRLDEIKEKQERLKGAERANQELISQLDLRFQVVGDLLKDPRTTTATVQSFHTPSQLYAAAKEGVLRGGGDPFASAASLAEAQREIEKVAAQAAADAELQAQARRNVAAAEKHLAAAEYQADESGRRNLADNETIRTARRAIRGLRGELDAAYDRLNQAHGDWSDVDAKAQKVSERAVEQLGILDGQLQAASDAQKAVQNALIVAALANGWPNNDSSIANAYGVTIGEMLWLGSITNSQTMIANGDYAGALALALAAQQAARSSIDAANAAVAERAAAEAQRLAEERAQREAREAALQQSYAPAPAPAEDGPSPSPSYDPPSSSSDDSGSGMSASDLGGGSDPSPGDSGPSNDSGSGFSSSDL